MTDDEIWTKFVYTKGISERERAITFAREILTREPAAPVASVDVQPVAWFIADDNGEVYRATGYEHERDQWLAVGHEVFPLYSSAQSEGWRKDAVRREALEEIAQALTAAGEHSAYEIVYRALSQKEPQ